MDSFGSNATSKNSNSDCADFVTMAERELSAFFRAVTELFGSEHAEISAEEWLREFTETESWPASLRDWRAITAKVSARLANRVHASSLSTEPQIA